MNDLLYLLPLPSEEKQIAFASLKKQKGFLKKQKGSRFFGHFIKEKKSASLVNVRTSPKEAEKKQKRSRKSILCTCFF